MTDKLHREIGQYEHSKETRLNNPPVGLVTPQTDQDGPKREFRYDPHIEPSLQWAGKAEHTSFEVPTVSLHVHERIDARRIVDQVRNYRSLGTQLSLFETSVENPPVRDAIDFYRHRHNWSNRLIAGDSLLVMNSLLEKESMAEKIQMIYMDPPYGIEYGSNFQPFTNKRIVKDRDEDLNQEPETIKAFRDTWELGIHSYLTYLRDRLQLGRELLHESGSIFLQISDQNIHLIRGLLDEIFGVSNYMGTILFKKTGGLKGNYLASVGDYIVWYCKDKSHVKYHQLYLPKKPGEAGATQFKYIIDHDGRIKELSQEELLKADPGKLVSHDNLTSQGNTVYDYEFRGKVYRSNFKPPKSSMDNLVKAGRVIAIGNTLRYIRRYTDFPYFELNRLWEDLSISGFSEKKTYVVQTTPLAIQRCLLMTTDPGELVLDPTCGSGTTALVAEQWGRRWITCDTSRVAITLAKQRLLTSAFDYYQLARPDEGVGSGFSYKTAEHVSLKSIANNESPAIETLYDQPFVDNNRTRVAGPFTVEAVPAPTVKPLQETDEGAGPQDATIARSGETLRQSEWRQELLRCGIRAKNGQRIEFSRVEPFQGAKWIQAEGETREDTPKRILISFGPEFAPLEQRQVEQAWQEARLFCPQMLLFCAFQFDEEAAKDIDELNPEIVGMQLLKAQMNADLFTDDLKKKRTSGDSFWLIGQPDVRVVKITDEYSKTKYQVEVLGFDYYNTKSGNVESGGKGNIAMWMLDTDYDGRSLFPSQVLFPMAGPDDGWAKIAKVLKAEIDEDRIEAFRGTLSLPFEGGKRNTIAIKIIDDRGIESLRVIRL